MTAALQPARTILPAVQTYRGTVTDPDRWQLYKPRVGDVVICTPAKAGTTWTQGIVAMLLLGSTDLPDRLTRISPWIEASFSPEQDIFPPFEAQTHRRVLKSHTPADGFPVWDGVHFISVSRHPLEILLSLRKHISNRAAIDDHPMKAPVDDALSYFLTTEFSPEQVDDDNLGNIIEHVRQARSDRWPNAIHLHYSDMKRDLPCTVALLNDRLGTGHDQAFVTEIAAATEFGAMKKNAETFVPEGGKGIWKDEAAFFAGGQSGGWRTEFTPEQVAAFETRLAELEPDPELRRWILMGQS